MTDTYLSGIVGGGGIYPPSSISNNKMTGTTSNYSSLPNFGMTISATVSLTTLTSVLSISGSGILLFGAIGRGSGADVTSSKIRIIIDGNEVLNDTSMATLSTSVFYAQSGVYSNNPNAISLGLVPFNSSLDVEIAGDGSNPATYTYMRHLS